jgi:hypothetical protein
VKIAKLGDEMRRLADIEARMLQSPDQQVSLTDPDARSMATSGRGSGVVGYNASTKASITRTGLSSSIQSSRHSGNSVV